jgi:homeobox-leucine zipper protein
VSLSVVTDWSLQNKWVESFPTIVSVAKTIEVISSGMLGNHSGSLQLVKKRSFKILSFFVSAFA